MNALPYPGPDRRESERRAAASATEFARGQKFGRHEADAEIARLTADLAAEREACAQICDAYHAEHSDAGFPREASTARALASKIRARAALAPIKQVDRPAVTEADISAAREHIADVHNSEQMRSALSQLRPEVVSELQARGLVLSGYGYVREVAKP